MLVETTLLFLIMARKAALLFTAQQVVLATGVSERCLHHWDRTGVVRPSQAADGPGIYRGYSRADILCVSIVRRMRDAGISLQRIRKSARYISTAVNKTLSQGGIPGVRVQNGHPLILIKGANGYREAEALVDALKGGQLVLVLDLGPIASEVESRLGSPNWQPRRVAVAAQTRP